MNAELIQRLVDQAKQSVPAGLDVTTWVDVYNAKFAELIVRECIVTLHRRGVEGFGIVEERMLKQHFGVEHD